MFSLFHEFPTFQIFLTFIVSLALTMIVMPLFIKLLKRNQIGQQVRADGPQGHLVKQGTPTMGGVVILLMMTASIFLVGIPDARLLLVLGATLLTGVLGFVDDASKVAKERSLGLLPHQKMAALIVISVAFCLIAVNYLGISPYVTIPFANIDVDFGVLTTTLPIGDGFDIPWLYVLLIFLLMAGMSNAVNLTDGIDGLASGVTIPVMVFFAVFASMWGTESGSSALALLPASLAGGLAGFLIYNFHPAKVFMGDTGSLFLGAAVCGMAFALDMPLVLILVGLVYIVETLSVMMQVTYFKLTHGKRIFRMTPIHHHFELGGWSEIKIWTVFVAVTCVMCILAGIGVMNRF